MCVYIYIYIVSYVSQVCLWRDRQTDRQRDSVCACERERQRDRETERQRDRETDRWTDRETVCVRV